jgi:hypothetical protein
MIKKSSHYSVRYRILGLEIRTGRHGEEDFIKNDDRAVC